MRSSRATKWRSGASDSLSDNLRSILFALLSAQRMPLDVVVAISDGPVWRSRMPFTDAAHRYRDRVVIDTAFIIDSIGDYITAQAFESVYHMFTIVGFDERAPSIIRDAITAWMMERRAGVEPGLARRDSRDIAGCSPTMRGR